MRIACQHLQAGLGSIISESKLNYNYFAKNVIDYIEITSIFECNRLNYNYFM